VRKLLLLSLVGFSLPTLARAADAWSLFPVDASGVEWKSGEGAALRLGGGLGVVFRQSRMVSVVHAYDVWSHDDPYHHWQLGYNSGPNGVYAGVRYQNQSHADQGEVGVTLGSPLASFGVGAIYDGEARRLHSIVLRGNVALIAIPLAQVFAPSESQDP
jgi:hypothetical protein